MTQLWTRLTKKPDALTRRRIHREITALCQSHVFDLVFVMGESFLNDDSLRCLKRSIEGPLVFHSHDNVFSSGVLTPRDFTQRLLRYDYVFTTKSQNVQKYRELGIERAYFLPSAFEPTWHRPIPDGESEFPGFAFPITFVGTYDHSRDRFLAPLWERLYVWGDRWERAPDYPKVRPHIQGKAIYGKRYADVLSHSLCALGLLREEASDLHTQRTFEIPACGALQITPRNEEICAFFEEDREIVCFEGPEELQEKVRFYLENEKPRKKIAEAGYKRCLQGSHTYLDRMRTILERVKSAS